MEKKSKQTKSNINRSRLPEVKMTKTARMRLLKANPLIKYEVEKSNDVKLVQNLSLDTVSRMNKIIFEKLVTNSKEENDSKRKQQESVKKNSEQPKSQKPKQKIHEANNHMINKLSKHDEKVKSFRRSISVPHLNKTLGTIDEAEDEALGRSISTENVTLSSKETILHGCKTPSDRRHSAFPHSASRRSSVFCSTPSAPADLKRRLNEWLSKRSKKSSAFKHLKCFGVHKIEIVQEEDKENFDTSSVEKCGSYEDLKIDNSKYPGLHLDETSLLFASSDLKRIAKEAMREISCLISEGYPMEQCEAWLRIVRNKCPEITQEPNYWECRASIEQLRGDIGSAVECYKTAVVQGAEVPTVQKSLDQLLEKFKLLEIDSSISNYESDKARAKTIQDFKNVFTSMVIKFAIQEKTIKNKPEKEDSRYAKDGNLSRILVTPVRRSTRLNRSGYTSTPGVNICSSLQEMDSQIKSQMIFHGNEAL
ncbi:hypothetical protein HHI36_020916 [Cryptolaemus montrouzieri]|uniref:Uncharacterized protein n=1 Tax=Cryptolaemus montrouzieri TaxID=559131 RepID=A0ABD2NBT1_9CUCU